MKLLSLFLMFTGYTLIYAGIANQGQFAENPWMGLFADAYPTVSGSSGGGAAPNSSPGAQTAPPSLTGPSSPLKKGGGGGPSVIGGILNNFNPLGPAQGILDAIGGLLG